MATLELRSRCCLELVREILESFQVITPPSRSRSFQTTDVDAADVVQKRNPNFVAGDMHDKFVHDRGPCILTTNVWVELSRTCRMAQ